MKQQEALQHLKKVGKVEAPPFLLTRIQAKIAARQVAQVPSSWKWAGALAFGTVLLLNLLAVGSVQPSRDSRSQIETLADGLQLSGTNQLYDE